MIKLEINQIENLKIEHFEAVKDFVEHLPVADIDNLYQDIIKLLGFGVFPPVRIKTDYSWLECFILADYVQLKYWAKNCSDDLKFTLFRNLYESKFSNGENKFIDSRGIYNAYTMLMKMDVHICPYCERDFLDIVVIDGKKRRTVELDHFLQKGTYPALAMCFYNLIPSCKACNQIKKSNLTPASPYADDIESLTCLYPDLPVGVNMENVKEEDCKVKFHAKGDMIINEKTLALEQRYESTAPYVHSLLRKKQQYSEEKIAEIAAMMGISPQQFKYDLFGKSRAQAKGKEPLTKMKYDLIGW